MGNRPLKVLIIVTEPTNAQTKQLLQDIDYNPKVVETWKVEHIGESKGRDYGIYACPSLIKVVNGKVVAKNTGYLSPAQLEQFLLT